MVPGRFTVSTSQPGSQYSTCTQGVVGLQKHGPVLLQLTHWRFTRDVQLGVLPCPSLPPAASAPPATTAPAATAGAGRGEDEGGAGGGEIEIKQIALAAALPTSHGKQAEGVVAWVEAHRATERFWAMRRVRPLAALLGREGSDGALGRGGDPALEGDDVEHVGRALLPVEWVVPGQDYLTGADEGGAGEDDGKDERRETRRGDDGCCGV